MSCYMRRRALPSIAIVHIYMIYCNAYYIVIYTPGERARDMDVIVINEVAR